MVLYTAVKCVAMLCAITATSAYSVTSSKRVVALSSGDLDATKCVAVLGQTAADDGWCLQNCGNTPPNCPPELCSCDGSGIAPSPSPEPVSELAALVPAVPVVYDTPEEADAARAEADAARAADDEKRVAAADAKRKVDEVATRATEQQSKAAHADEVVAADAAQVAHDATKAAAEKASVDKDKELTKAQAAREAATDAADGKEVADDVPEEVDMCDGPGCDDKDEQEDKKLSAKKAPSSVALASGKKHVTKKGASKKVDASEEPPMAEAGTGSKTTKAKASSVAPKASSKGGAHAKSAPKSAAHLAKEAKEEEAAEKKLAKKSLAPSPEPSPEPTGDSDVASCAAVVGQTAADDAWCIQNCGNVPPNCPAELCSCDGMEVASAVPAVPVPSPGAANPSLTDAVADRQTAHQAEQEVFRKADEDRVKAADAAREADEVGMRGTEQERKSSSADSVKERDAAQVLRDEKSASYKGPETSVGTAAVVDTQEAEEKEEKETKSSKKSKKSSSKSTKSTKATKSTKSELKTKGKHPTELIQKSSKPKEQQQQQQQQQQQEQQEQQQQQEQEQEQDSSEPAHAASNTAGAELKVRPLPIAHCPNAPMPQCPNAPMPNAHHCPSSPIIAHHSPMQCPIQCPIQCLIQCPMTNPMPNSQCPIQCPMPIPMPIAHNPMPIIAHSIAHCPHPHPNPNPNQVNTENSALETAETARVENEAAAAALVRAADDARANMESDSEARRIAAEGAADKERTDRQQQQQERRSGFEVSREATVQQHTDSIQDKEASDKQARPKHSPNPNPSPYPSSNPSSNPNPSSSPSS